MPLFRRYEGDLVKGEGFTRKLMPFLMPGRNEAMVMLEQQVDVTPLLAYLDRKNAGLAEKKVSFWQVCLCAMLRANGMRPKMNRFVVANRIYQRKWIDISFAIKKKLHDEAIMTVKKVRFDKDDTLDVVADRVAQAIGSGRSQKKTSSEVEMRIVTSLPRFLVRFLMGLLRWLDSMNLMPAAMIRSDELYTSMFVANLGSVGLEAPYHHLYEWGTCPLFGTFGKIEKKPIVDERGNLVVRDVLPYKWSFDERITDGFYCGRSLELFKYFMQNPELLEVKPTPEQNIVDNPPAKKLNGGASDPASHSVAVEV